MVSIPCGPTSRKTIPFSSGISSRGRARILEHVDRGGGLFGDVASNDLIQRRLTSDGGRRSFLAGRGLVRKPGRC
jgi:hypothetical protein